MTETRWFRHGGMEFEVELDSPAHRNLVAGGAEPIVNPESAVPARRGRKAKAAPEPEAQVVDGDTLGDAEDGE